LCIERRPAVAVPDVGAGFDQLNYNFIVCLNGVVEGRAASGVPGIGVCAMLQQKLFHGAIAPRGYPAAFQFSFSAHQMDASSLVLVGLVAPPNTSAE
jgi:hypothetical protein